MPQSPSQHRQPGQRPYREREQERKRGIDRDRGTAAQRGYGSRWQAYRVAYLARHALCVRCEVKGLVVAANVVNHIRDHRGDMRLFWDVGNHEALCDACHNAHTARTVLNASKTIGISPPRPRS